MLSKEKLLEEIQKQITYYRGVVLYNNEKKTSEITLQIAANNEAMIEKIHLLQHLKKDIELGNFDK